MDSGWDVFSLERVRLLGHRIAPAFIALAAVALFVLLVVGGSLIWRLVQVAWWNNADESIRAASAALTAIAALIGAGFLTWRTVVSHWQARASQAQVTIARENHYTTLFTKAVEQLGATREVKEMVQKKVGELTQVEPLVRTEANLEVRLGAIYALGRIARDSERDHWPIMEVLCAYLRSEQNTGVATPKSEGVDVADWIFSAPKVRPDIQAALEVIGQRSAERVIFERQNGLRLDLRGANLRKANLTDLNMSFVRLNGAHLEGALLFYTSLEDASLDGANLTGANLSFASLDQASLKKSILNDCLFWSTTARRADFRHSTFNYARFENARLNDAIFMHSSARGARFYLCEADSVNFSNASFDGVWFVNSSLSEIVVASASLYDIALLKIDLSTAHGLTQEQLTEVLAAHDVRLPEGLTLSHVRLNPELSSNILTALDSSIASVLSNEVGFHDQPAGHFLSRDTLWQQITSLRWRTVSA